MFCSGWPNVRRVPAAKRFWSSVMWHARQPTDSTSACPRSASPRGGDDTANAWSSEFANRYATTASISTSLRRESSGALVFELYQTRGIQVLGLTMRGSRIHDATHSGESFDAIFVRFGPGFRRSVNPVVVWQA